MSSKHSSDKKIVVCPELDLGGWMGVKHVSKDCFGQFKNISKLIQK
jgi:hypothetical protein